ncbi:MAG: proline--tRNA ligase [Acidimicrobiales bacterium]
MRWSNLFIPTLRDAPADAEAASHKLLIRGGFIRQLMSGHYSLLPLGLKVHDKVANIVREEMNAIGGQEFLLPAMHPKSIWEASGRWSTMGDEMFRLQDRKGADLALGMTHEEIFATVATEINSYKQLPQIWYQIQWKFRDEPRPKSGLLRVREFAMKDAYTFDVDEAGLDIGYEKHREAYVRIFHRLGLDATAVQASSGAMGGSGSSEFMVPSSAGEDDVAMCPKCGYAANVERACTALPAIADEPGPDEPVKFPTPDVRTIAALEEIDGGATAERQIKTMVYVVDGAVTLFLLRGDHKLNEQKVIDNSGTADVRPATPDETVKFLGASPGSLGALGVSDDIEIYADEALRGRSNLTTGANDDDWHWSGVDIARDIEVDTWCDLRTVSAGEPCPDCNTPIEIVRCIEVGHIFKLGSQYAEAMGATILDQNGKAQTIVMGSYGIGIGRNMATIAETNNDESGIVWPVSVAPFEAVITVVRINDEPSMTAAETIYSELLDSGIDVVLDDRNERPGVKFKDAELIGIPYRITVGPKGLEKNAVELTERATGETVDVALDVVVAQLTQTISDARKPAMT